MAINYCHHGTLTYIMWPYWIFFLFILQQLAHLEWRCLIRFNWLYLDEESNNKYRYGNAHWAWINKVSHLWDQSLIGTSYLVQPAAIEESYECTSYYSPPVWESHASVCRFGQLFMAKHCSHIFTEVLCCFVQIGCINWVVTGNIKDGSVTSVPQWF